MNLQKVDLFVLQDNLAAICCYQKVGFQIEATIENKLIINGENKALYLMEIEREDCKN
jgi:RimJ/RimL family protein N-acetyltransferase